MIYSAEVKGMCPVHQGVHHGSAYPIFQDTLTASAGVHLSREPASFHSTLRTVSFRKPWLRLLAAPE